MRTYIFKNIGTSRVVKTDETVEVIARDKAEAERRLNACVRNYEGIEFEYLYELKSNSATFVLPAADIESKHQRRKTLKKRKQ